MPIQVKICGINSIAAADAVLAAGADYGGLVFFERSPRNLTLDSGSALAARMRGRLKLVALVVDADNDRLAAIAAAVKPDLFQLHGSETPERAADIRARFDIPIIKAIHLAGPENIAGAGAYDAADMLLFDTPPEVNATRPGGHGAAFDWRMLKDVAVGKPWFLAGGLTPDNLARALEVSGAMLADVSSGVESAPGVKNSARIAEFVAAAARSTVNA